MKAIVNPTPNQKRFAGYHVEALAVEAIRSYRGACTVKSLLLHVLAMSAKRVLRPIDDITGQTKNIDASLGETNSPQRRVLSRFLQGVVRRLESATSVNEWKTIIEA